MTTQPECRNASPALSSAPRETEEYLAASLRDAVEADILRQVRRGRVVVGISARSRWSSSLLLFVHRRPRPLQEPRRATWSPDVTSGSTRVLADSPLVNGKETLVRLYLSLPSCEGQDLDRDRGRDARRTWVARAAPSPPRRRFRPRRLSRDRHVRRRSGGGFGRRPEVRRPRFDGSDRGVHPNFSTTLTYQARASKNDPYGPVQQVTPRLGPARRPQ